jgi:hypothetical protein
VFEHAALAFCDYVSVLLDGFGEIFAHAVLSSGKFGETSSTLLDPMAHFGAYWAIVAVELFDLGELFVGKFEIRA